MTGVVIVTGAAQGIGFATVESLVLAGYSVIGLDLLPPVEPWTLQDTHPHPVWHLCDVTDEAAIAQVVAPPEQVQALLDKHYGSAEVNIDDVLKELENAPESTLASEGVDLNEAGSAPII